MKKIFKAIAAIGMSAGVCLSFAACGEKSTADKALTEEGGSYSTVEEGSPYSIITKLDLNISFDNNTVYGRVKNTFTLFPATARVYVYLYYSESYTTDYTQMQEVAQNYIGDLDMKKTLTARYEMQGESGYFLTRMRYKIDSRDWEERTTDAYKRDYSGIYMQPIADDGSLPVFEDIQPAVPYIYYGDYKGYEKIYKEEYFYADPWSPSENVQTNYKFEEKTIKDYIQSINKEFYIFAPKDIKLNAWANEIEYTVFHNNTSYIFRKYMVLDIPQFGYVYLPSEDPTGRGVWNLVLHCEFKEIDRTNLNGKLKLEFGAWDSPLKGDKYIVHDDKFINLYIGETCIGTCYYDTTSIKEITYPFFYNLFAEGLRVI